MRITYKSLAAFTVAFAFSAIGFGETLRLGKTGTTEISVPEGWANDIKGGSTARGVEYQMNITPPAGTKAKCIVTLIATHDSKPMPKREYRHQVDGYSAEMARRSVEKKPAPKPWFPKNGTGEYYSLTDEWLAGKDPVPNHYKFADLFFAQYKNGVVLIATALADDAGGAELRQMRRIFESIDPSLNVPATGKIKVSKTNRGTLFYTHSRASG